MTRIRIAAVFAAALFTLGLASGGVQALDVIWDGGDGIWDDQNWNGGQDLNDVTGSTDGSNGWGGAFREPEVMENFIISGPTSSVVYDANTRGSDFRMKQGSTLTISDGATWSQISDDTWSENRWTELDISGLLLDGGTFSRIGSVNDEGGGAFIVGSWRGDDNFGNPDSGDHFNSSITITNGGRLENEGQLWLGGWGDAPYPSFDQFPEPSQGMTITVTINDGTIDLTGGDVVIDAERSEYFADADLIVANRFLYQDFGGGVDEYLQPQIAINFTGPGSITVDRSGIINTYRDENGDWQNLEPITWEELWDAGILQADGQSGPDGAVFSNYFSVTGALGQDDYTVAWAQSSLPGDYNSDGVVDTADIDLQAIAMADAMPDLGTYDENGDGLVNDEDRIIWVQDHAKTWFGDSNFDGVFSTDDLVAVFAAGKYETTNAANWSEGDWTGDQVFDSGDLVAAFSDGGFELGPRPAVASVPEPAGLTLLALASLGLLAIRRR